MVEGERHSGDGLLDRCELWWWVASCYSTPLWVGCQANQEGALQSRLLDEARQEGGRCGEIVKDDTDGAKGR